MEASSPDEVVQHPSGTRVVHKLNGEYQTASIQSYDASSKSYVITLQGGSTDTLTVQESEILTVQDCIREIHRDVTLDPSTKAKAIQSIQMPRVQVATEESETNKGATVFSHSEAPPCEHYVCMCVIVAACCNRVFQCRICHDEHVESHKIDR
jgi:hypothetical protein